MYDLTRKHKLMKTTITTLILIAVTFITQAQTHFVRLITDKGNITLVLYDETPKHRDQFLQVIKSGFYTDAQFNRVIKGFVSQGGELDETILEREKHHPNQPLDRIDAELPSNLYHKKGALGAGRNDNPDKSSYFTQIYLVEGKIYTDEELNALEEKRGIKIPLNQRKVYKTIGGIPRLDGDYTLFGEIVEGMDVAEEINSAATDKEDMPIEPLHFRAEILSEKEAAKLRKKFKKNFIPNKI